MLIELSWMPSQACWVSCNTDHTLARLQGQHVLSNMHIFTEIILVKFGENSDNFQGSQGWKFHRNDIIFISVLWCISFNSGGVISRAETIHRHTGIPAIQRLRYISRYALYQQTWYKLFQSLAPTTIVLWRNRRKYKYDFMFFCK